MKYLFKKKVHLNFFSSTKCVTCISVSETPWSLRHGLCSPPQSRKTQYFATSLLVDENKLLLRCTSYLHVRCFDGIHLPSSPSRSFYHLSLPTSPALCKNAPSPPRAADMCVPLEPGQPLRGLITEGLPSVITSSSAAGAGTS